MHSKMIPDPALFHNAICRVTGFDFVVYGKVHFCNRTVPNIMVTLAVTDKNATVFGQNSPDFFLVFSHYAVNLTLRSNWK